ncbi:protein of unknown function DUF1549 [hydrothermal vent metagenome]|uniref:Cytochrome c domain-containing protein n=1 Tax=hydrothermal vent metagenome TaxID=652676 RepID=A0A3B1DQC4_9ZZZZ
MKQSYFISLTVVVTFVVMWFTVTLAKENVTKTPSTEDEFRWEGEWKLSRNHSARFIDNEKNKTNSLGIQIQGTGKRNNPLRRKLSKPFRGEEIYLRFAFRYAAKKPRSNKLNDNEFFVLWLDRLDGSDEAVHAQNVPNIGVHSPERGSNKKKNLFMVRIGQRHVAWSQVELKKEKTYQIVARLSKTKKGIRDDFDRLDLWIDPHTTDFNQPDATIIESKSINVIRWIGFATGRRTEKNDQIQVDDLTLSKSWNDALSSDATQTKSKPVQPTEFVWAKKVNFKKDVYPLLKKRCFECHSGSNPDSGYRLDVLEELYGESNGEPLIVLGKSNQSRLIELVNTSNAEEIMPPTDEGKRLTKKEIALLRAWIDQGVNWDETLLPPPVVQSDHWAFQQIVRPQVPEFFAKEKKLAPIDAFIRSKQKEKKIRPNGQASRRVLARRLSLDVIGLPPTQQEMQTFLNDKAPDAYEKLVDRLLASPHYGERWGRYWLDLARWTESMGYQHDIPRPYAWRYRDYVIQSFNEDKPYSQFLKEQIAGDEIKPLSDSNLVATGFLAAARINGNQMDKKQQRNNVLVDIVNVTGSSILGLTLECAQCHNHKFDPVSQRDYYRLHGFFVNGQIRNLKLSEKTTSNPTNLKEWIPKKGLDFYHRERKKLKQKQPQKPHTWGYYSPLTGLKSIELFPVVNRSPLPYRPEILKQTKPHLLIRGSASKPGPEVRPGWPKVLGKTPTTLGRKPRIELANWFASRNNPLVSRVWVNRIWQYHFGQGLVRTTSDFGVEGAKPSHPKLLDWLAVELMKNNWSTKHLHRQILLSHTYRQSKKTDQHNEKIDAENQYLWRWNHRRLEAEAIRDSTLVATGELKRTIGGHSIPQSKEEQNLRRTIYLFQRRSEMPSVMTLFDAPEGRASCSRRAVSTVALQPLYLLNSKFMSKRSETLAKRIQQQVGNNPAKQIEAAFLRILCRPPSQLELSKSLEVLIKQKSKSSGLSLKQFCQALMNLNEFLYIP